MPPRDFAMFVGGAIIQPRVLDAYVSCECCGHATEAINDEVRYKVRDKVYFGVSHLKRGHNGARVYEALMIDHKIRHPYPEREQARLRLRQVGSNRR